jgi:hypothetical protein
MIHKFHDSLAKSHEYEDAEWWEQVYKSAFRDFAAMVSTRQDGWAQRGGIDRVITLSFGRTITVDEKVREKDWPDVLLETWSDKERKSPGWMQKKLAIDYIAYAYAESRTCLLLPFDLLRVAWLDNGADWILQARNRSNGYRVVHAKNQGYTTESIAVPRDDLLSAIQGAMVVNWRQQDSEAA